VHQPMVLQVGPDAPPTLAVPLLGSLTAPVEDASRATSGEEGPPVLPPSAPTLLMQNVGRATSVVGPPPVQPPGRPTRLRAGSTMRLRGLHIDPSGPYTAQVQLGSAYGIRADSLKFEVVRAAHVPGSAVPLSLDGAATTSLLTLDSKGDLVLNTLHVRASALDVAGGFTVGGVPQWHLVHTEDFSTQGAGWSRGDVTTCGGVAMLGGFCKFSSGEVNKTFVGLPPHRRIKLKANYHFIDRWIGETGYMKLSVGTGGCPVVVWSEMHKQDESKNGISLCGQPGTPDGKFTVPIDVSFSHSGSSVSLSFGSTMEDSDPCDESWGVSDFEIYVMS